MKPNKDIKIFSPVVQEAYDSISALDWATDAITDGIAGRIVAVMKEKGISKKELASSTKSRFFHFCTVFTDTLCCSAKTVFGKFDLFISRRMCIFVVAFAWWVCSIICFFFN